LTDLAAPELAGDAPLLDIGCGTGWWLERLAQRGVAPERLHGVELDPVRASAAAARVRGATVRYVDARTLPWADDTFAAAFLLLVLSSAGGRGASSVILADARRVVRPGGLIAVWEPRVPTPANRSTRRVTLAELRAALGVESTSCPVTLLPPLARRVGPRAYRGLARITPLRTHRLVAYRGS
jgi:SAM-dependent methyltransferase